ncbi:MAG TPA: hypothetical protein VFZ21_13165 [Gemmatimonadaceae bacterium]|jgi:hypothetical protein|nr:hypothetical protein [Gemmatimonadaceae bacterium]
MPDDVSVPTVNDVDAIAAIADPVVRNLRITQCYSDLSRAIAARVSPGANWCTFATWASRQAGQTIRGEDFTQAASDILGSREVAERIARVVRLSARGIGDTSATIRRVLDVEGALRRSSEAVAVGNRKVFMEIGREFARWLSTAAASGAPDATATATFCEHLRPGEPPEGQRLLREAFVAYGEACRAPNESERAARLFLGNLLVGLHEQTRLQPEIRASLDAALDADAIRAQLLALVFPGVWLRARAQVARLTGRPLPADLAVDALLAAVRHRIRLVLTELLMTLRLPGTVVRLASDVRGEFPSELRTIEHEPLRALLARIDPTPDATARSGATDWSNLAERMHFIADLFRCWHARAELFTAPYDAVQIAAMREGRRPGGVL